MNVVHHQTNSPGALKVKAGVKLVSTVLAASAACQESHLGITSGNGYYTPNVRADDFGATCSRLGPLPRAVPKGCWICFGREIHFCTVRSFWREHFIVGNKTEKSSDEPPIDQEHRPGDRADQAHRVQLTARSIISLDCLIDWWNRFSIFCLLLLRKALF